MSEKIFDISIHMDLGDNGGVIAFKTVEDVKNWAEDEFQAWNFLNLSGNSDTPRAEALIEIVEKQMAGAENLLDVSRKSMSLKIPVADAESHIRKYLSDYAVSKVIHRDSVLGRMIMTMKDYQAMVLGMISGAVGSASPDAGRLFSDDADTEAFTLGYALGLQFKVGSRPEIVAERIKDIEARLDNIVERVAGIDNSSKKTLEDHQYFSFKMSESIKEAKNEGTLHKRDLEDLLILSKDKIAKLIDDYKGQLKAIGKEGDATIEVLKNDFIDKVRELKLENIKQINELEEACLEKLKMKPSIEYWMDISKINTLKSIQLTVWFGIVGIFGVFALIGVGFALMRSGLIYSFMVTGAVMSLLVFIFIVLLSIIVKSRGLHEKASILAQQKVVMIETLEALENEGRINKDEKKLFVKELMKDGDLNKAKEKIKENK